ncbi:ABC transporter ATP-binding protein [Nonomuraea insulae]|uniref:ABC transporter ATP-binding protein n=1 Tax=Nonomuraea insulae TaxID=1616787 RepID=A0ABW1D0X1_9ACTN
MSTASRMAGLIWRSAPLHIALYLALTVAGALTSVIVAWMTRSALDQLVSRGPLGVLVGLASGIAVWGMVGALSPRLGQYLRAELDRRAGLRAKDTLYAAVGRFDGIGRFEEPAFLDRLRMADMSATSSGQLVDSTFRVVQSVLTVVGFLGSLAVISPWFTAVVLTATVPAFFVELRLVRQRTSMMWNISPIQRRELFYAGLLGTVQAAKEIRLLGLGAFLRERMLDEVRRGNATRRRMDRGELLRQSGLIALAGLVAGGGLVWVIMSAGRGALSVGDVSMFVAATAGVQASAAGLVGAIAQLHQQLLLFRHYEAVVTAEPDLRIPAQLRELPALRRGIELHDVWFRYSDEHPWVLRGVNLFLPHGATVALVGRNGDGKSTIVKLLCRFYDPTRGDIRWDGVDIRDVPVDQLRARLGAVFQDFMAYEFSATDNIAVGDLPALNDHDRIELAAREAGAHDTLAALPRGYDTLLTRAFRSQAESGEAQAGMALSGGQWQRVALARAFLRRDRDLVILDEPSAGLDAEAEHEVHTRLRELRAGRTSLLISHRLGTIRDADHIVVLADGVIVEQGTHHELIAMGDAYARMFTLQAAGYADTNEPSSASEYATKSRS